MDTSETYIKMCDCEEIQALWKPQVGDWFYKKDGIGFGLWCISDVKGESICGCGEGMHRPPFDGVPIWFMAKENYIWLPRQDQLQAMLSIEPIEAYWLVSMWMNNRALSNETSLDSMEQLWLAFVMKENHNKIWDGEEWN